MDALIRFTSALFRRLVRMAFGSKRSRETQKAQAAEEERLDRIRNPYKYRPGNLE
jgi:hypothetical protein